MLNSCKHSVIRQAFDAEFLRRYRHLPHQPAAFQKQRHLRHRQLQRVLLLPSPQLGKLTALQPLRVQAQPRPVPQQHLRPLAVPAHEQEQVTRQRVLREQAGHQTVQPIHALAHVRRHGVREDPHRPRRPDHPTTLSKNANVGASRPSTVYPRGVTSRRAPAGAAWSSSTAGTIDTERNPAASAFRSVRSHRASVDSTKPSRRAMSPNGSPPSRHTRAYDTIRKRSSAGHRHFLLRPDRSSSPTSPASRSHKLLSSDALTPRACRIHGDSARRATARSYPC
jgi:hypothetical protein